MTTRVIETWQYKGFWVGTEHTGACAQIALDNSSQKWKATNGEETIAYVSKSWAFNQDEAMRFHEMFKAGKLIHHRIDFSEWNEAAKKWRQVRRKK